MSGRRWRIAAAAGVLLAMPFAAGAETDHERGVHASLAIGGFGALTGPASAGPQVDAELFPGGALGRFGLSASWRGQDGVDTGTGMVLAGVSFEGGSSRPRLTMAVRGELGAAYGERTRPVVGGGGKAQLWLLGPLALAASAGGHLIVDGVDSQLALTASLLLAVGR